MGSVILLVGGVVVLIGAIMLLVEAFRESFLWGIGTLIVPFVFFAFIVLHWNVAKKAFLVWLVGVGIVALGHVMGGDVPWGSHKGV